MLFSDVAVDFHEYRPYCRDFVFFGENGITKFYDVMLPFTAVIQRSREYSATDSRCFRGGCEKGDDKAGLNPSRLYFYAKDYG